VPEAILVMDVCRSIGGRRNNGSDTEKSMEHGAGSMEPSIYWLTNSESDLFTYLLGALCAFAREFGLRIANFFPGRLALGPLRSALCFLLRILDFNLGVRPR
jgi:hypothetical protein